PGAIAEAIVYLLEHPEEARRMGENGRVAVLERYNWGEMEGRLLGVYRAIGVREVIESSEEPMSAHALDET
ncbi:MAG: glycosyltransferase, partial [Methanoculleus sp.]